MPYSDPEKQREANKRAMQRQREQAKGITEGITVVIPEPQNVIPDSHAAVIPSVELIDQQTGADWQGVRVALRRDPDNLARLQAVAESLGKFSGEVRFGLSGPTFDQIGKQIGTGGPVSPHTSEPVMLGVHPHIMDFGKRA